MTLRRLLLAGLALAARAQEVPLEIGLHRELILRVEAEAVDGKTRTLRMLLDTGAVACVVDPQCARGLHGAPFRREIVQGFAGAGRPALARSLRHLRCGSAVQADVPALVMELGHLNRWLDRPVDGVLGMSFLAGRSFTLDAGHGVLRWEGPALAGRDVPLMFMRQDPRPWASLRIGGREVRALVDTGSAVALVLPKGTVGTTSLPECDTVAGMDGVRTISEARVEVEAFGEHFPGRRAMIGGPHPILGLPFLLAGPATFDLRRGRLILSVDPAGRLIRPRATDEGARSLPICWNRSGTTPFLEVDTLPPCHRWYRAGFRGGDRVISAGPLEGAALNLEGLDGLLRHGRILEWSLRRGTSRLTLRNPDEDPRLEPLDALGDP